MPLILKIGNSDVANAKGYFGTTVIFSVIMMFCFWLCAWKTKENVDMGQTQTAGQQKYSIVQSLKAVVKNKYRILLIITTILGSVATMGRMSTLSYFVIYCMGSYTLISPMYTIMSVTCLVGTVLMPYTTKLFGKRNLLIIYNLAAIICYVIIFSIPASSTGLILFLTAVIGITNSQQYVLFGLVSDRVIEMPDHISGEIRLDRDTGRMQDKWQRGPAARSYDHERVLDDMNHKVLELIDRYGESGKPFFIYYPTPAVHGPLLPKAEFKGKSGLNAYADIVLQLDDMIHQITEKLEQKGMLEDTILVFTSDNGCSGVADYPYLTAKGHNPSAWFRGKKFSIYEGGHRVPTIVHYPAMISPGSICESNVCHTDFFRTFAELLGVDVPEDAAEDSYSNLELWKGTGKCGRKATVYSSGAGYFGIVSGKWKLACCENGGDGEAAMRSAFTKTPIRQQFELYNMEEDVREERNVIKEHPEIVKELTTELTRCLENGRPTDGKKQANFEPDYPWIQVNWKQEED